MKKVVFAILTLALSAVCASAQVNSNTQTVSLNVTIPEFITIDAPSVASVAFTYNPMSSSPSAGSAIPAWNTNWVIKPGKTVSVCAYISADLAGTTGNTDVMPIHAVMGQPDTTGTFVPFGGDVSACGHAGGLVISQTSITTHNYQYTKHDSIALQIGAQYGRIPDTYSGTLNIVAQAL